VCRCHFASSSAPPPGPVGVARRCYRYHRWCRGMPAGSRAAAGALALTCQSARLRPANPPVTAICDAAAPPATQLSGRPHLPQVAGPKPATDPAAQCGGVSCLRGGAPGRARGAASHGELKQVFVDRWIIPILYLFEVRGGKTGERDASDHNGADAAWPGGLTWCVRRSGTWSGCRAAGHALGAWTPWRVWGMGARPLGSMTLQA
jgi:hypothetical protein